MPCRLDLHWPSSAVGRSKTDTERTRLILTRVSQTIGWQRASREKGMGEAFPPFFDEYTVDQVFRLFM